MAQPPALMRRWRRQALLVVVLVAASAILAAVAESTALDAVALAIFGLAGVLGISLVFYEIGRSEDRSPDALRRQGASRSTDQEPPSSR